MPRAPPLAFVLTSRRQDCRSLLAMLAQLGAAVREFGDPLGLVEAGGAAPDLLFATLGDFPRDRLLILPALQRGWPAARLVVLVEDVPAFAELHLPAGLSALEWPAAFESVRALVECA